MLHVPIALLVWFQVLTADNEAERIFKALHAS